MLRFNYNATHEATFRGEGDCTIRAFASFFDVDYNEAREYITTFTDYKPETGVTDVLYDNLLKSLGMVYVKRVVVLSAKNAEQRLPYAAILHYKDHVCAYKDGTIHDGFFLPYGYRRIKGYWAMPDVVGA